MVVAVICIRSGSVGGRNIDEANVEVAIDLEAEESFVKIMVASFVHPSRSVHQRHGDEIDLYTGVD